MTRTMLLSLVTVLAVWTVAPNGATAVAPQTAVVGPELQDTLEKDLRARRPREFEFIAKVIELVELGTLPESLVRSTYLWARKKPRHKFQYFERGMRFRAGKLDIDL